MTTPLEQLDSISKSLTDAYEAVTYQYDERMRLISLLRFQLEAETVPKEPKRSSKQIEIIRKNILGFLKKKSGWWSKSTLVMALGHSFETIEPELAALASAGSIQYDKSEKTYSFVREPEQPMPTVDTVRDVTLRFLKKNKDNWSSFQLASRLGYSKDVIETELALLIQENQVEYNLPTNTYRLTPQPETEE